MIPDYLLIGHMTADLVPAGRIIGGTVSYAARTAKAFGLRVAVLTSTAKDDPLLDQLRPYVDDLIVIEAEQTSTFENIYTDQGRVQYIRGTAKSLSYEQLPEAWRDTPLVHLAPLTGELDPEMAARFPNATTMLTAQGVLRQWGDDGRIHFKRWCVASVLKALDWLVLSEEDIVLAPELEQVYAELAHHFVLTRAEQGGTHYDHGVPTHYPTPAVEVIQPTGAGDVFAASLLASLYLLDGDVTASLDVAAHMGATSVTRDGVLGTPTPDEVQQVLSIYQDR